MGIIYIENRKYASKCACYNPRDLKDMVDFQFTPEVYKLNECLTPQATFVLSNTVDLLLLVHIGYSYNKKFYFGYTICIDDVYESCGPVPDLNISKGYDSIYSCMSGAIDHCSNFSKIFGTNTDYRIDSACKQAIRDINKLRLHQMTIFEML